MASSLLISAGGDLFQFRIAAGELDPAHRDSRGGARSQALAGRPPCFLPPRATTCTRWRSPRASWCGSPATAPPRCGTAGSIGSTRRNSTSPRRTGGRRIPSRIAYLQFDVSRQPLYPHADLLPLAAGLRAAALPQGGRSERRCPPGRGVGRRRRDHAGWTSATPATRCWPASHWVPDSRGLFVQRLNRVQNRLDLMRAGCRHRQGPRGARGKRTPTGSTSATSCGFSRTAPSSCGRSERDGFRHLYRYSADGKQLARLDLRRLGGDRAGRRGRSQPARCTSSPPRPALWSATSTA